MIEVTAIRKEFQTPVKTRKKSVKVPGFERLTPRAARVALEIAFGNADTGEVWHGDIGYRVYKDSARKVRRESS